jgi:preprotein translocase subunit SecG
MRLALTIAQIIVSALLVGAILIQAKGTGLEAGAVFGGSGEFYSSRRGVERVVFISTIVLSGLFAVLSFVLLVWH